MKSMRKTPYIVPQPDWMTDTICVTEDSGTPGRVHVQVIMDDSRSFADDLKRAVSHAFRLVAEREAAERWSQDRGGW